MEIKIDYQANNDDKIFAVVSDIGGLMYLYKNSTYGGSEDEIEIKDGSILVKMKPNQVQLLKEGAKYELYKLVDNKAEIISEGMINESKESNDI